MNVSSLLGSGGGGYGNSGSSGVSTPVTTTQGGIGSQSFVFGGNPNVQKAVETFSNPVFIVGAVVVVLGYLYIRSRSR
jgi:hypothetical protein